MSKPNLAQQCSEKFIGTIPLKNAHIWYHRSYDEKASKSLLFVIQSGVRFERTKSIDGNRIMFDNTGACNSSWGKSKQSELIDELKELLIELSLSGGDMKQMLPEMMKIREFAALGCKSMNMCRAFSEAVTGAAYEDPEVWRHYK